MNTNFIEDVATWIPLTWGQNQLPLPGRETSVAGQVQTVKAPSPYDLPDAVGIAADTRRHTLRIFFRYLDSERTQPQIARRDLVFHVGINSGRLWQIEFNNVDPTRVESIRAALDGGLDTLEAQAPRVAKRKWNFVAAREATRSSAEQLARAAVATTPIS